MANVHRDMGPKSEIPTTELSLGVSPKAFSKVMLLDLDEEMLMSLSSPRALKWPPRTLVSLISKVDKKKVKN